MLTLWGPGGDNRYCDGRSRREFLKLGGLAMGGLSLPGLLQAEAVARRESHWGPGRGLVAQVGDHDLPDGRPGAPGYLRPQA